MVFRSLDLDHKDREHFKVRVKKSSGLKTKIMMTVFHIATSVFMFSPHSVIISKIELVNFIILLLTSVFFLI